MSALCSCWESLGCPVGQQWRIVAADIAQILGTYGGKRERKLFSEGKYSSLGPERNHMCLVFHQPGWIPGLDQMLLACFAS